MPIGTGRMPLFDHLGELRRRLVIIIASVLATSVVLYMATDQMIFFLIQPIKEYLPQDQTPLNVLNPLGGFTIRFKVAIYGSLVVCSPLIIWEILAFFLPALKPNERKWVVPTVAASVVLFVIGLVFCYAVILRPAFEWMTSQTEAIGTVLPNAETYLNIILLFEVAFGIAFQLPLVVFYLIVFNIVPYKKLRSLWREIYVGLLVLSAIVTPDANPITMIFMFAALLSLYEISLALSRIVLNKRIQKQKELAIAADEE